MLVHLKLKNADNVSLSFGGSGSVWKGSICASEQWGKADGKQGSLHAVGVQGETCAPGCICWAPVRLPGAGVSRSMRRRTRCPHLAQ